MTLSATIYSDANYGGKSRTLATGNYNNNFGLSNDSLSSVRVPSGLMVVLYENSDFGGRRCVLVRDTPSLGSVNDETTSIVVCEAGEPTVIVYNDANFCGWSETVLPGMHVSVPIGNDRISSVIVPPGYRVTLYEDSNFRGSSIELTSDAANLGSWNDRVSSLIVEKLSDIPPTLDELNKLIAQYGPRVYFHPSDEFGPSSVEWFLARANLQGTDGTSRLASQAPLPEGGSDDGSYWLVGSSGARGGDMSTATSYVNAKFQNSWIYVQFWFFYPYNGGGKATVTVVDVTKNIDLTPMGEHGGDWEHVTLKFDRSSKSLRAMYLAQHSGGKWLQLGDIPMENGRPAVLASRHGHASYSGEGTNLSNGTSASELGVKWFEFGLVNETQKGTKILECSSKYQILRADFVTQGVTAPQWTQFCHRWGPHITYSTNQLKDNIRRQLGSIPYADKAVDAIWSAIPDEAKEENGPTGPWMKGSWKGDE